MKSFSETQEENIMEKVDYKKVYRDLYLPKKAVSKVDVPAIQFIGVKGRGLPGSSEFQNAISLLYAYTFSIKMSKMNGSQPDGYFEFVVPPLEAIWGTDEIVFDYSNKDTWIWTMMIRQPEFVSTSVFESTKELLRKKKPELDVDSASFFTFTEGTCAQIMHIGSYDSEYRSIDKINAYIKENGLQISGKHHEIYLSDPRRTRPEKLKTVLRLPVKTI